MAEGVHRSVIDYILVDNHTSQYVTQIRIDDLGELEVGSDHNWIWCDLDFPIGRTKTPCSRKQWKINEGTEWQLFREGMDESIRELHHELGATEGLSGVQIETRVQKLVQSIKTVASEHIGKKKPSAGKKPSIKRKTRGYPR